jgi:hypothetical protein
MPEAENLRGRQRRRIAKQARLAKPAPPPKTPLEIPADPPIHTVLAVAAEFNIGVQTVRMWIRKGAIYGVRAGNGKGIFLIPESEVLRVRAERQGGASGPIPFGWAPSLARRDGDDPGEAA